MDESERKRLLYPEHPGFGPEEEEPTTATLRLTFDIICAEDPDELAGQMWALVKNALDDRGVAVDGGTRDGSATPTPGSATEPTSGPPAG